MRCAVIIPARYGSTRYPGKPLVELNGSDGAKTLIRRTWDVAQQIDGADSYVCTDDERIADHARGFGAEVIMTSSDARNGTERCAEAVAHLPDADLIVNLQGDAPLTPVWFVEALIDAMRSDADMQMATPVLRCDAHTYSSFVEDRLAGRVGGTTAVFDHAGRALYFSKEVIPYTGGKLSEDGTCPVFHHVGVYAYRPSALGAYPRWESGPLEQLEGLEQLRFMEHGRQVLCVEVQAKGRQFWELNNPEDVPRIEAMMAEMGTP